MVVNINEIGLCSIRNITINEENIAIHILRAHDGKEYLIQTSCVPEQTTMQIKHEFHIREPYPHEIEVSIGSLYITSDFKVTEINSLENDNGTHINRPN